MEYRILGPLEVLRDGVPIVVRGRHQPKLLAMLLLEAGRTVTLSRLVEVLWDDDPPATARRQVQNYMAALRRSLGADDAVEAVGEGYRLAVGDSFVDSVRFEELNDLARQDAREGRHADALPRFDEALALWRAPALAGLSARALESRTRRLDDLRLGMIENRAEVLLALGRHGDVVGDLTELLAEKPYRQQAARHLMLALYRCGRGSDALAVFEELRRRLAEEVGIDPNPMVRELQGRILREDSALDAPRGEVAVAAPEVPVPAQLPAGVTTFTGREEELAELDKVFDAGASIAVVSAISGGGGVGKTALAVHWGRKRAERFPDGQLYVNLRGFDHGEPLKPIEALSRFLRALGIPGAKVPSDTDEASVLYRSILNDRRILVVLDNARTVDQVRPLLPGGGGNTVLVTSRNRLASLAALDDAKLMALDVLSQTKSLELLAELIGAERLHADPISARRLVELCGSLPLALRIAAASLASRLETSVADFVSELDSAARLELLAIEDDPGAAVTATFELSISALSVEARELFLRLGMVPGDDIPEGLAIAVSEHTSAKAMEQLRGLISAHLLESHAEGRYRFHDLVKIFARQRANVILSKSVNVAIVDRLIEWYDNNVKRLGPEDASNLVATCEALRNHPKMWRVAMGLQQVNEYGVGQNIGRDHCETALQLARENNDMLGQVRMLSRLGGIHYMLGNTETGIEYCREAVSVAEKNVDKVTLGSVCNNLGLHLYWNCEYGEAESWLMKALNLVDSSVEKTSLQIRLQNLGNVLRALGRFAEAAECLDRSTALLAESKHSLAAVTSSIARATLHNDLGRYEYARRLSGEALVMAHREASHLHVAFALQQHGQAESGCQNTDRARDDFRESLALSERLGMPTMEQAGYCLLAELECDLGDQQLALQYLRAASEAGVAQPTRYLVAEAVRIEGKIRLRLNEHRRAVELGVEAVAHYSSMPAPLRHARSLTSLANAYEGLGDQAQAEVSRRQALAIFTRLGVPVPAGVRHRGA